MGKTVEAVFSLSPLFWFIILAATVAVMHHFYNGGTIEEAAPFPLLRAGVSGGGGVTSTPVGYGASGWYADVSFYLAYVAVGLFFASTGTKENDKHGKTLSLLTTGVAAVYAAIGIHALVVYQDIKPLFSFLFIFYNALAGLAMFFAGSLVLMVLAVPVGRALGAVLTKK